MATLDYDKIINGIRKALYGYEVREYFAQAMEYVKSTMESGITTIQNVLKQAQAARDAASTSAFNAASSASAAKTSEVNAKASADSMGTSVATCTTKAKEAKASEEAAAKSEAAAKASKEAAEKSAELAGTRAGTDKTLSVEDAPADAAVVGRYILDRTKDTPELVFYSKAETDAKIKEILAAQREEDYKRVRYWVSDDPTSPASFIGGTWEQIKDKFILAAGDTYAAGSVGGKASVALEARNIPRLWGQSLAFDVSGNNFHVTQWGWVVSARQISSQNGFNAYDGLYVTVGDDNNSAVDVMPPYVAKYVWQRIE